jgi:four helix bundle protein
MGSVISSLAAGIISQAEEASSARSDSGFCSKLDGLLQEADESQLWLELIRDDCGIQGEPLDHLLRESDELLAIFATMVAKLRKSNH